MNYAVRINHYTLAVRCHTYFYSIYLPDARRSIYDVHNNIQNYIKILNNNNV